MDINIDDLPYLIHFCFALHNFWEMHKEAINPIYIEAATKCGPEFQPPLQTGYSINNNKGNRKQIQKVFVKYFYQLHLLN